MRVLPTRTDTLVFNNHYGVQVGGDAQLLGFDIFSVDGVVKASALQNSANQPGFVVAQTLLSGQQAV